MQHLHQSDLDELKEHLRKQQNELTARIDELKKQDPYEDPDRLTDNAASDTEASEEAGHERVTALIEELQQTLVRVDISLTRMKDGTYGTCEVCHALIDVERLRILPTAVLCVDCEGKKQVKPS